MAGQSLLYMEKVLRKEIKGVVPTLLCGICAFLCLPYGLVVIIRNKLYQYGLMKAKKLPVPVVSIGNIVAGGTGKTPMTLMLARLMQIHATIGVLFRGYRSQAEKRIQATVLSTGSGPLMGPEKAGDEPFMIAKSLLGAIVVCCKDRVAGGRCAIKHGAQLLFVDDGFQHRRLHRDVDIVLLDGADPFGGGRLLPRGFLREPVSSLQRADWIIINGAHQLLPQDRLLIEKINPGARVVGVEPMPLGLWDRKGRQARRDLEGKNIAVFCGIAKPSRFFTMLQSLGAHIVCRYVLPDHGSFTEQAFSKFVEKACLSGAEAIVCTEKDLVKIADGWPCPLPILWLQLTYTFVEGEAHWFELMQTLQRLVERK